MKFLNINWGSRLAAAVVVWGATAYHYINTGMSISMIAFTLFVIAYALKIMRFPRLHFIKYSMGVRCILCLPVYFHAVSFGQYWKYVWRII